MTYEQLRDSLTSAFFRTVAAAALITAGFMALEPTISRGASTTENDQFTVSQTIGDEISFETNANDVVMSEALTGLTGGQSTGTSQFAVRTNSPTGFTVTLQFSSSTAMNRFNGTSYDEISNYTPSGTTSPTLNFDIGGSGTPGEFGYTVDASTSYFVAEEFRTNGTICNVGAAGVDGTDQCWQAPSSTAANLIINATSSTPASGATSSVVFVVEIPSNPNPTIPSGTYVATATLTATVQ